MVRTDVFADLARGGARMVHEQCRERWYICTDQEGTHTRVERWGQLSRWSGVNLFRDGRGTSVL